MCGIVGYVGPERRRQGARRRDGGPAPAGVPRVRLGRCGPGRRRRRRHREARRQAGQPGRGARARSRCRPSSDRHRAHPLGHPRRPHRRQRPPAPRRRRRQAGPDPQRHHRELRRAQGRAAGRRAWPSCPRPTPRSPRTCWPRRLRQDRRPDRGHARGRAPARRRLHAAGRARRRARRGRRRPPQLPAGRRPRRRRELPRLRRRRLHRPHPRGARARPGPDRDDHRRRASTVIDFDGTPGRRASTTTSTGTPPPPRRAATPPSWRRRSTSSRTRSADTLLGRTDEDGRLVLDELRISEDDLRSIDKIVVIACGTAAYAGHGRQVRDRALVPDPRRGRAGARVPLPRPGGQRAHAGGLDLAVRRDDGHPDGGPARPRAGRPHALHLQHPRLDDPARVRRRALHPRRPRDRGRLHQGVPGPDHRLLPARALPRPAARRQVRRRGRRPS